jgi:serine/threonine protein kinase
MIIRRKYEILKKIGAGGMASVYLARHLAFDEIRAIKIVRSWLAEDEGFLRRLRSEAVILRKLQHPNAVRVDDIDNSEDGRPFIVMEYVQGSDLHSVIRDQGPLSVARVVSIAMQVASALGAAHKLGITHRDVKPDNILLVRQEDGSELAKVLDFGIAKLHGTSVGESSMTQTGLVLCTPQYASPEQARGLSSDRLDGRSDLYSLGVVMYEMLTGELPFHSDTPMGMLLAQMNSTPRPPMELKPELNIPSAMSDLLMKALEKDPDQRFQSAEEMLDAMAHMDDYSAPPAVDRNADTVPIPSAGTMRNIRLQADSTAEYKEPQREELSAPPDLLLELDEPRSTPRHLWIWALTAVLVLAAGGVIKSRLHPSAANTDTAAEHRSDGDVLIGVKQKLTAIEGGQSIQATVAKGVVSLTGAAPSSSVIDKAALDVSAVPGVARVDKSKVQVMKSPLQGAFAKATATPPVASQPATAGQSRPSPAPSIQLPNRKDDAAARASAPAAANRVLELMKTAQQAMDDGDYDVAITNYATALEIDHGNTEARAGKRKAEHAKQYEEQLESQE